MKNNQFPAFKKERKRLAGNCFSLFKRITFLLSTFENILFVNDSLQHLKEKWMLQVPESLMSKRMFQSNVDVC